MKKILTLLLLIITVSAQIKQQTVAILNFEGIGINNVEKNLFIEKFVSEIGNNDSLIIIPSEIIETILNDKGIYESVCASFECGLEIGQILGVDYIINGSLIKVDDLNSFQGIVIDVKNESKIKSIDYNQPGEMELMNTQGIKMLIEELSDVNFIEPDLTHINLYLYTSNSSSDNTPPVLTNLTIAPQTVDVRNNSEQFTVTVSATDDVSGLQKVWLYLESPNGTAYVGSMPPFDGSLSDTITWSPSIGMWSEPGDWYLKYFWIYDVTGNIKKYSKDDLSGLGFPNKISVTSNTDSKAPELTNLTITPQTVDVRNNSEQFTVTVSATDDSSGLQKVWLYLESPNGTAYVGSMPPFDGSLSNTTTWSPSIGMWSEPGDWYLKYFWIYDVTGNIKKYSKDDLSGLGFPNKISVTSNTDSKAPELTNYFISPDTVNNSGASRPFYNEVAATDDSSGLQKVWLYLESPNGTAYVGSMPPFDGSLSDTTTWVPYIGEYKESGDWYLKYFWIYDVTGNIKKYSKDDLSGLGFPNKVVVDVNAEIKYPIVLTTKTATSIIKSSAYLNGYVSIYGGSHQFYFQYGKDSNVTENEKNVGVSSSGVTASFNTGVKVENLIPATNYSFRLISKSSSGEVQGYGNTLTFATPSNTSPVISTINNLTVNEDASGTATLGATDADGDAITYSAVSDTNAITVSVSSTTLTLTPTANWNGVANIKAYASDGSAKDSTLFKLTVTAVNDAPVITAVSNESTNEETEKSIVLSASDIDGDALTYSASSDTSAVAVTVSTNTLKLTPALNYTGTSVITVIVSDNALTDTTKFDFTVINVNDAPVISTLSDVTIKEDETGSVSLSATDIDGDAITYSAVSDTNAITVSVSSTTLTLTPTANWNGVANIKAYASDGSAKDSTSFKLTVTPVQDTPTAFDWVSSALDTINITQSNLDDNYNLQWDASTDAADGDSINYLLYAKIGVNPPEEIYDTTSTSVSITYEEFLENVFEPFPMLPRVTVKFTIVATDGIDTVNVTGDDRVVSVNRYEYLSTADEGIPTEFALHDNYPNPFNPTTTLRFDLPEVSNITLTIYNMLGQKVKTFNMQSTPAGYHSLTWDATNDLGQQVGAGVYLYQLQAKDFVKTRKMVLLK